MEQIINSKINGFKSEFICNKCNNKQEINIFPYINFSQNPEYYSLVKDLSIYKIKCEKCGEIQLIKYDTLIVNETQKYFIYFLTDKSLYNRFKYQIRYFIETDLNKDGKYNFDEYKTRLVFNHNDLIEKIDIFEIGLKDEAIELIKSGLIEKEIINSTIYDSLYFDGLDNSDLLFVAFNSNTSLQKPQKIKIDFKFYNKVVDNINKILNKKSELFEVIDREWVSKNFDNSDELKENTEKNS